MKNKPQGPSSKSGRALLRVLFAFATLPLIVFAATYPQWWTDRGVVSSSEGTVTNDYAPATLGQLKWFATQAKNEFNTNLPGGASTAITAIVDGFANSNDYVAATLGQGKWVAKPFYDQLIEVGYATNFPWDSSTNAPNDFAPMLIGQLKTLFNFDLHGGADSDSDGMPDWWEMAYGMNPSDPDDAVADLDEDGWSNLAEYNQATNPSDNSSAPAFVASSGLTVYTTLE